MYSTNRRDIQGSIGWQTVAASYQTHEPRSISRQGCVATISTQTLTTPYMLYPTINYPRQRRPAGNIPTQARVHADIPLSPIRPECCVGRI